MHTKLRPWPVHDEPVIGIEWLLEIIVHAVHKHDSSQPGHTHVQLNALHAYAIGNTQALVFLEKWQILLIWMASKINTEAKWP
jgi:hypothetical protein